VAYSAEQLAKINELEASVDGTPIDIGDFVNGEPVDETTWDTRQTLINGLLTRLWYRITQRYIKPAGGIPSSDLANPVQVTLANAYVLPVGGVPEGDLSSAVQTKLNRVYGDSWQDPVADIVDLPLVGNTLGDVRVVTNTEETYTWNGAAWVVSSGSGGGGFFDPATWMMV